MVWVDAIAVWSSAFSVTNPVVKVKGCDFKDAYKVTSSASPKVV